MYVCMLQECNNCFYLMHLTSALRALRKHVGIAHVVHGMDYLYSIVMDDERRKTLARERKRKQ